MLRLYDPLETAGAATSDHAAAPCAIAPAPPTVQKTCRHCGERPPDRRRGLCWRCYYTPTIRERYDQLQAQEHGAARGPRPLPDRPTNALPGSPEKVAVLAARRAAGVQLWHPLDARVAVGEDLESAFLRRAA